MYGTGARDARALMEEPSGDVWVGRNSEREETSG